MSPTELTRGIVDAVRAASTDPIEMGVPALHRAIPDEADLLDEVIGSDTTDAVDVRIHATGGPVHPRAYSTTVRDPRGRTVERLSPTKVVDLFAAGATVIVDNVARTVPRLRAVARTLRSGLALADVDMALFATPNGHSGLPVHVDDVDVVVVQLAGAKRWDLWERTLADDDTVRAKSMESELAGVSPDRSHILGAGTLMYVPAGTPHRTSAVPQAGSIHLSIMLTRPSVRDLLVATMESAARAAGVELDTPTTTPATAAAHVLDHLAGVVAVPDVDEVRPGSVRSLLTVDDHDTVVLPGSTRFDSSVDDAGRVRLTGRRGTTAVSAAMATQLHAVPTDTAVAVADLLPDGGRDRSRVAALTLLRAGILHRRSDERTP